MVSATVQDEPQKEDTHSDSAMEITTLWDFPYQCYGDSKKGDNRFPGVTPASVIRNLIRRYTEPGDLVVDCMAGSGTTVDVAREENRRVVGYDIAAIRSDIIQSDARDIPLEDECVDLHFVDSPYSDNIHYSNHPDCIGKIPCENEQFFEELEKVSKEIHRTLKSGGILGWLIADQFRRRKFTPVGFRLFEILSRRFKPVDIVAVKIHNQRTNTELWQRRALKYNFFLRGFKYLLIMRKAE